MSEYDQMQAQKEQIIERHSKKVFEAALDALRVGAPGLSETSREAVARNIALRVSKLT